jgi:class 3 adenylate cyclase
VERKLATILFVDLVGSTALVTGSDPEVARRRIDDYFSRATQAIAAHGGTVEKFVGDAVMAAFGAPRAHEDDAERAVRAAFEIFDALLELGLEARAGIESGEVVIGEGDSTFVTGEAINVAARLQQSGRPGAIMLGPAARRLTEGTVEAAASGAIAVDGVRRVPSSQALRILAEPRRQADSLFVGRRYELDLLAGLYQRSLGDRRARLVTVTGEPGIGKSRLVAEFVDGRGRAIVLKGRALPYGDGVGYWPIASMIRSAAGIRDDEPAERTLPKLRYAWGDAIGELLGVVPGCPDVRHGAALARLTAERELDDLLAGLAERDLVEAEEISTISGESAFRFRHALVCDVAYSSMSKGTRARAHRTVAGWLGERAPDELLEICAYHLDRACVLLSELETELPQSLVAEAAAALDRAGDRAFSRESFASARRLYLRASTLAPTVERRYLAAHTSLQLGDLATSAIESEAVRADAVAIADHRIEGRALCDLAAVALARAATRPSPPGWRRTPSACSRRRRPMLASTLIEDWPSLPGGVAGRARRRATTARCWRSRIAPAGRTSGSSHGGVSCGSTSCGWSWTPRKSCSLHLRRPVAGLSNVLAPRMPSALCGGCRAGSWRRRRRSPKPALSSWRPASRARPPSAACCSAGSRLSKATSISPRASSERGSASWKRARTMAVSAKRNAVSPRRCSNVGKSRSRSGARSPLGCA